MSHARLYRLLDEWSRLDTLYNKTKPSAKGKKTILERRNRVAILISKIRARG